MRSVLLALVPKETREFLRHRLPWDIIGPMYLLLLNWVAMAMIIISSPIKKDWWGVTLFILATIGFYLGYFLYMMLAVRHWRLSRAAAEVACPPELMPCLQVMAIP